MNVPAAVQLRRPQRAKKSCGTLRARSPLPDPDAHRDYTENKCRFLHLIVGDKRGVRIRFPRARLATWMLEASIFRTSPPLCCFKPISSVLVYLKPASDTGQRGPASAHRTISSSMGSPKE